MDKPPYTGWLTSPDLVKRSFAIMGHFFFAYLMILLSLTLVFVVIGTLSAIADLF